MKEYELWLILMDISNYEKVKLIEKYNNEENIYNNIDNIINKNEINKIFIKRFKHRDIYKEEDFKKFLYKNDIQYVTLSSNLYPEKLKYISNPPYMLFYKGDLSLVNEKMIAVIGARKNTLYGEQVAKMIANELFEVSYGVVSGDAPMVFKNLKRHIEMFTNLDDVPVNLIKEDDEYRQVEQQFVEEVQNLPDDNKID